MQSRKVYRNAFWSSITAKILYVVVGLALIYFILFLFCGGLRLQKCFG